MDNKSYLFHSLLFNRELKRKFVFNFLSENERDLTSILVRDIFGEYHYLSYANGEYFYDSETINENEALYYIDKLDITNLDLFRVGNKYEKYFSTERDFLESNIYKDLINEFPALPNTEYLSARNTYNKYLIVNHNIDGIEKQFIIFPYFLNIEKNIENKELSFSCLVGEIVDGNIDFNSLVNLGLDELEFILQGLAQEQLILNPNITIEEAFSVHNFQENEAMIMYYNYLIRNRGKDYEMPIKTSQYQFQLSDDKIGYSLNFDDKEPIKFLNFMDFYQRTVLTEDVEIPFVQEYFDINFSNIDLKRNVDVFSDYLKHQLEGKLEIMSNNFNKRLNMYTMSQEDTMLKDIVLNYSSSANKIQNGLLIFPLSLMATKEMHEQMQSIMNSAQLNKDTVSTDNEILRFYDEKIVGHIDRINDVDLFEYQKLLLNILDVSQISCFRENLDVFLEQSNKLGFDFAISDLQEKYKKINNLSELLNSFEKLDYNSAAKCIKEFCSEINYPYNFNGMTDYDICFQFDEVLLPKITSDIYGELQNSFSKELYKQSIINYAKNNLDMDINSVDMAMFQLFLTKYNNYNTNNYLTDTKKIDLDILISDFIEYDFINFDKNSGLNFTDMQNGLDKFKRHSFKNSFVIDDISRINDLKKEFDENIENRKINLICEYIYNDIDFPENSRGLDNLIKDYKKNKELYGQTCAKDILINMLGNLDIEYVNKLYDDNRRNLNLYFEMAYIDFDSTLKSVLEKLDSNGNNMLSFKKGHEQFDIIKNNDNSFDIIKNNDTTEIYHMKNLSIHEVIQETLLFVNNDILREKIKAEILNPIYFEWATGDSIRIRYEDVSIEEMNEETILLEDSVKKSLSQGYKFVFSSNIKNGGENEYIEIIPTSDDKYIMRSYRTDARDVSLKTLDLHYYNFHVNSDSFINPNTIIVHHNHSISDIEKPNIVVKTNVFDSVEDILHEMSKFNLREWSHQIYPFVLDKNSEYSSSKAYIGNIGKNSDDININNRIVQAQLLQNLKNINNFSLNNDWLINYLGSQEGFINGYTCYLSNHKGNKCLFEIQASNNNADGKPKKFDIKIINLNTNSTELIENAFVFNSKNELVINRMKYGYKIDDILTTVAKNQSFASKHVYVFVQDFFEKSKTWGQAHHELQDFLQREDFLTDNLIGTTTEKIVEIIQTKYIDKYPNLLAILNNDTFKNQASVDTLQNIKDYLNSYKKLTMKTSEVFNRHVIITDPSDYSKKSSKDKGVDIKQNEQTKKEQEQQQEQEKEKEKEGIYIAG